MAKRGKHGGMANVAREAKRQFLSPSPLLSSLSLWFVLS